MAYPLAEHVQLPIDPYAVSDRFWRFGDRVPRRLGLWAQHLGDDIVLPAGTAVNAIGAGRVVWAKVLPGNQDHRSWGGVVVIGHRRNDGQDFFSVYGHLRALAVKVGVIVASGQQLGEIASANTAENGWWKIAHLHFAIYTGPWRGAILPGYWRPERFWQTQRRWWHDPKKFIEESQRA